MQEPKPYNKNVDAGVRVNIICGMRFILGHKQGVLDNPVMSTHSHIADMLL